MVARQSLYSVYVHANPDFEGYKPKSPFYGKIIPDELRIMTGWGEHSTTEVGDLPCLCWLRQRTISAPAEDLQLYLGAPHPHCSAQHD